MNAKEINSVNAEKKEDRVFVINSSTDKFVVLGLEGRMVYENSGFFAEELLGRINEGFSYIIDVDKLERIDSTGLGVLITFAKQVESSKGKVGFVINNEFSNELFTIAQFDQVFPIAGTWEEAVRTINNGYQPNITLVGY